MEFDAKAAESEGKLVRAGSGTGVLATGTTDLCGFSNGCGVIRFRIVRAAR